MVNLEEVMVEKREGEGEQSVRPAGEEPRTNPGKKRRRSRKRRDSGDSGASVQSSQSGNDTEGRSENGSRERATQPTDSQKQGPPPTQEDYRTTFYEMYHKEAKGYDRDFIKRYDEDLTTTLIFAGLFSAVTSAFIIQVQPQLQPDPNEETAALLRVLIHKIDNTTFGNDVPAVPQWSGAPHTIIQVQAILYTSLATSLFSALLAMLGKQWLNRYASIDMRGSAIERSQDRQRKLDGVVSWYFLHVLETLPLMLQFALLLLSCALSRYLWEVDTTIASVVLGVTSVGVTSYTFFVVAGAASSSCPYQTPGAHVLRRILPFALSALYSTSSHTLSALRSAFSHSESINAFKGFLKDLRGTRCSISGLALLVSLPALYLIGLLVFLVIDAYSLTRAVVRGIVANAPRVHGWSHRVRGWFHSTRGCDPQKTVLDLQCISWMLQTSLDKTIRLFTLRLLAMMTTLTKFYPAPVSACIDILAGCMSIIEGKAAILHGSEELAAVSALCCLHILSHLTAVGSASGAFEDVRRRYTRAFPIKTDFEGLPSYHHFQIIHNTFYPSRKRVQFQHLRRPRLQWKGYKLSSDDHVIIVQLAHLEYQRKQNDKMPRWILRYARHVLSQDPLPPAPVVADCISIIAMDLGCTIPDATAPADESARLEDVSNLITGKLETTAQVEDWDHVKGKCKAIFALLPYAAWRERGGDNRMVLAFTAFVKDPGRSWLLGRLITPLLAEAGRDYLNRVITLLSPCVDCISWEIGESTVNLWAAAALVVPYTEGVGQRVIDTLLQIASNDRLLPYIPVDVWALLKNRPPLRPMCVGRSLGTKGHVVRRVRELGDVEILASYFLVVWSEWDRIWSDGFAEMCTSIREEFGGIGMRRHREVLIQRLDHVLGELEKGLDHFTQQKPYLEQVQIASRREQHARLKEELLEVDREASEILTKTHSTFICALPLPCP